VHKSTVAKQILRDYQPDNDLFPSYHIPKLREAALDKYAHEVDELKRAYAARRGQAVDA
jgi:acyl-CoA dehydrogenase